MQARRVHTRVADPIPHVRREAGRDSEMWDALSSKEGPGVGARVSAERARRVEPRRRLVVRRRNERVKLNTAPSV